MKQKKLWELAKLEQFVLCVGLRSMIKWGHERQENYRVLGVWQDHTENRFPYRPHRTPHLL